MSEREREGAPVAPGGGESIRLDKWLWFARFFKSRTLATRFLEAGKVRMRGTVVKPHARVRIDDVITFVLGGGLRIVRIRLLGSRRGPAVEARTLYEDLSPPREAPLAAAAEPAARDPGAGRPTKAERRAIDRLRAADES
jgi:ribosome-associated heat shock protein Hsp15